MNLYLENWMNIDFVHKELSNTDPNFYFAFYQNQTIGYLKLNFNSEQTESVQTIKPLKLNVSK